MHYKCLIKKPEHVAAMFFSLIIIYAIKLC